MKSSTTWALVATLILAALAGAWLSARTGEPTALQFGTRIDPPQPLPSTVLTGQDGSDFDRAKLHGRWSLMFFGFTHCPGICPMTLTTLAQTKKQLGGLAPDEQPQIVFVSVDPERDTPDLVARYMSQFDPSFTGVTGSVAAIDDYMVDHTATIMMIDPQGRRVAVFSPPFTAEHLATDYMRMLGRS